MKTIFCVIISILALVMSGCSNAVSESDLPNIVFEDMPEIVFKVCTSYNQYEYGDGCSLTFVDKNGNYYFSDYSEIFFLSNEELIETLKSGDERITKLYASCDTGELSENYKKLLKVATNEKYELVYPEAMPDVEAESIMWYGLFYDKDGKLSSLPLHARERMTGIDANDDRANEIFEWYSGALKTQ